jgi:putative membrane protein
MGFGFVVARFGLFLREFAAAGQAIPHHSSGVSFWVGTGLIILGVIVHALATFQHISVVRRLASGQTWRFKPSVLGISVTVILICVGVCLTAYLILTSP